MERPLLQRMRDDWNGRAREDAGYYVAFGRRNQSDEEFFATASDVVRAVEFELRRLAPAPPRARKALEIGCGPGRLMRPLSRHFGEIHGVDISDEMIRRARENLRGVPHAHAHVAENSDLAAFAGDSFDLVYSYAVFQHIPSREVIFGYLREARRVLKPGAILRFQINGLPETARRRDTWSGARVSAAEMADFAAGHDMQLLALEGIETQYMWVTCRKQADGWSAALAGKPAPAPARIRRITNAHGSEPLAPTRGRFSSISLWMENLPEDAGLNHLAVRIAGRDGFVSYLGPPEPDGLVQLNVYLPAQLDTGLQPVEVLWIGRPLCPPATLRLIPPAPPVPRVVSVTDGIDLLSETRIVTGSVKIVLEEVARPEALQAMIGGQPLLDLRFFLTDPRMPAWEVNGRVPASLAPGVHSLELSLGGRRFAPVRLEIGPPETRL